MNNYDNNMRGFLFKNSKKTTENHPDYTGNCEIDGKQIRLSAWIKESKKGAKYMSLAFTAKEDSEQGDNGGSDNEDMPF